MIDSMAKIDFMNKNLLSQLPCTVTAQPCLCRRLLTSNAALPPSSFSKIQPWIQQTNKLIAMNWFYEQKSAFSTIVHGYSTALPLQQAAYKQCRFATILSHWHCTAELPDCPSSFLEFCRKNKFQSNFKSILDYFLFSISIQYFCQKNNWKELGDGY